MIMLRNLRYRKLKMKKTKKPEIKSLKRKIKNFNRRWNIDINDNQSFIFFKNRVLNILKNLFRTMLVEGEFISEYLHIVGEKEKSSIVVESSFPVIDNLSDKTYNLSKDSRIYKIIENCSDFKKLIFYLQGFFWCKQINATIKTELYKKIKKTIDISFIPVKLIHKNNSYKFYPAGAKLLDKKIVNELLDWLEEYPEVYKHFNLSLKQYMKKESPRNILDNLRFSLEQLLKKVLRNRKSLKNQREELYRYLKTKNINQEIINMYNTLISQYAKYQNENVKHNEKLSEKEIEFIIYLTGSFMRFLLTLSKGGKNE